MSALSERRQLEPFIVSLASYPPRINEAYRCIESLLAQTALPERILLWLSKEEFPGGMDDLPSTLRNMTNSMFHIEWVDVNLKPHNKYYWAMQLFPDAIIVTVDDDVLYAPTMLEELLRCHQLFPEAVIGNRTHVMVVNEEGKLRPYDTWIKEQEIMLEEPSTMLIATGVGGVLYPPHLLPEETFDLEKIQGVALEADDLWLKAMEVKAGIPTVATGHTRVNYIPGTQEDGLWLTVNSCGGNDVALNLLSAELDPCSESLLKGWAASSLNVAGGFVKQRELARKASWENAALASERDRAISDVNEKRGELEILERRLAEERERRREALESKEAEIADLKKRARMLDEEISLRKGEIFQIRQSWSFRIGRSLIKPFSFLRRICFKLFRSRSA